MRKGPKPVPFEDRYVPEPNSGCWLWLGSFFSSGYGQVMQGEKNRRAHRVAYEMAHGAIPEGLSVLHRCDVRACVNPAHLFLGTAADNSADMIAKRRAKPPRGERHWNAKLTPEKVSAIRSDPRLGRRGIAVQIARELGVTYSLIYKIIRGQGWQTAAQ